jgi:hypothetical protein
MVPVKGHRLYIYISIKQLCAPDLGPGAFVQHILGASGEINPQILDTILIPAGVRDLLGMDGQGAAQILGSAFHGIMTVFSHGNTSSIRVQNSLCPA